MYKNQNPKYIATNRHRLSLANICEYGSFYELYIDQ